ncbi:DNA translocase FtsK [Shinella daejeonensis]|uniref:DNA translocase FtsK n=1 Tax=Shinella daejeonensis TaxID=659017 RepID=UPI003F5CD274|nr:DNA translocase FtsK [Shinella daejeonensis]
MHISRTNFYPVLQTEDDDDARQSRHPFENNGLNGGLDAGDAWRSEDAPIANDDYRPRFRSPALREYDPGRYADGSWESHFYMAPNVRFTRTPDKPAARIEEMIAPEDVRPEETPGLPSEADLLQRLREALDERRQRFEIQQQALVAENVVPIHRAATVDDGGAEAASATIAGAAAEPIITADVPSPSAETAGEAVAVERIETSSDVESLAPALAGFAHLSDFAFWETLIPDMAERPTQVPASPILPVSRQPVMPVAVTAPVIPVVPASAPIAAPVAEPVSIASLFRVVECRTPVQTERPAEPSAAASPADNASAPASAVEISSPAAAEAPAAVAAPAPVVEPVRDIPASGLSRSRPFQVSMAAPAAGDAAYEYPSHALLQEPPRTVGFVLTQEQLEQNAGLLESVLEDFGVRGEIIHVRPGPVVTLYEFEPAPGVKSSRVIGLADDIARSMSALSARVAVVPGRNVIGIELPNATRETVYFREMIDSPDFARTGFKLPICLGKTIGGEPVIAELAKMPHLLVAGTTGSGKSVAINTMILSLLYRFRPDECRLIMVDPKMLELSIYDGIPHLLTPVVTDPKKAVMALKWAVREMEDRYRKMSRLGVRNIDGYNNRVAAARDKGETITISVQTGFDKGTGEAINEEQELSLDPMPYIVVIVDEMADLMMVAGKEIEGAIQRLAQMARAAGIHLIMATQRPSVDVITGTIKANFPTRISFQVTSKIDSRTILGEQGAEQLLGQGDMLHMAGGGRIMRVHGPFVSDEEVEKVVLHLKTQGRPDYLETVTADEEDPEEDRQTAGAVFDKGEIAAEDGDDLYEKAVKVVTRDRKCSTSYIQRRLAIGYNRAASLVERMEKEGLVGPANHVGKREIISGERNDYVGHGGDDAG